MNRFHATATAFVSAFFLAGALAQAAVINFGVDIKSSKHNPHTQVAGGYTGAPSEGGTEGRKLEDDDFITFMFDTTGLSTATITGFELFVDAEEVDCDGSCSSGDADDDTRFKVFLLDPSESLAGYLADVSRHSTLVPVLNGEFGAHAKTPNEHDGDNAFFTYTSGDAFTRFAALIGAGSLGVKIQGVGRHNDEIRIDGANLQVSYTPFVAPPQAPQDPEPPVNQVPEPHSMALFGMGLLFAAHRVRRQGK